MKKLSSLAYEKIMASGCFQEAYKNFVSTAFFWEATFLWDFRTNKTFTDEISLALLVANYFANANKHKLKKKRKVFGKLSHFFVMYYFRKHNNMYA